MRKITFLLTALLLSVVASAQVATGVYTIGVDANQKRGYIGYGYTEANETQTVYQNFPVLTGITWNDNQGNFTGNSSTAKENGNNWYIVSNAAGTGYYLYNVAKSKFIEPRNDNNAYYTDTPYLWSISAPTDPSYSAYYNIINPKATGVNKYLSGACGTAPANKNVKIGNNATDGGSLMTLTAVDDGMNTFATQIEAADQAILNAVLVPARSMAQNSTGKRVGAYRYEDVADLRTALSTYQKAPTPANLAAVELAYNDVKANGTKVTLSANEKFTVKCVEDSRGYLVYSTVSDKGSETRPYLAGTTYGHPALTADGVYKEWAYVEKDGKKLIFNVQKKQFINTDYIVKFSDLGYAFNFVGLEDYLWEIKVEGESKYLSFSPGWSSGEIVRLESSVDNGCKFYIDKVDGNGSITDALEDEMLAINWKGAERLALGYVGGYPSDAASDLEAVNSSSEKAAFEVNHSNGSRIQMAEGYYFLRSATNQQKKDAYLSYNGTNCNVFTLGDGEKLSAKHVWYLKSSENGYKMMACNLQKYLTTANAAAASPNPTVSPITSDFEYGFKYVLSSGDISGSWILTDGHDHVLRTEGDGRVNYWTSNTNATWYIIPATELDVNIGATGYATTYLPFDVTLPDDLTAYAVTETSGSEATLAAKNSIPAGQGALLKGVANTGYKLTISKNAVTPWDVNKLKGTYTTQNIAPDANTTCYVLAANGSSEAGFYKVTLNQAENKAFQNNANKAYLPVSTDGARFLTFDFDDNAETGISAVEIEEAVPANAAIYDLSGRRVQSAKSGLYIINGKKVIK